MARPKKRWLFRGKTLQARVEAVDSYWQLPTSHRNRVLKQLGWRASANWRAKNMRRRFTREVLRSPFGYRRDRETPLVGLTPNSSPDKLMNAVYRGNIRATASKGFLKTAIPTPTGHPVHRDINRVLKIITDDERDEWSDTVAQAFISVDKATELARRKRPTRKPPKRNLSAQQRREFGIKPRRSR